MSSETEAAGTEARLQPLARLAQAAAVSVAPDDDGGDFARLGAALHRRAAHRRRRGAVVAVAVVFALSFAARSVWVQRHAPLRYAAEGTTVGGDGYIARVQTPSARLQFSDGTQVDLAQQTRARVLSTSPHGAAVRIDDGRAHFSVVHRPRARWSVEAGPFVVQVSGTTFDVSWSAATDVLRVRLLSGVVSVVGPLTRGGITLLPGQELVAHPDRGTFRIEPAGASQDTSTPPLTMPSPEPSVRDSPPPAAPVPAARRRSAIFVPAPRPTQHPTPHRVRVAIDIGSEWSARIASGDFESIVGDAERCSDDGCVDSLPSDRLAVLGDAARYTGRRQLARRVLLAQRARFPGTAAAHEAGFLLGRLAEDTGKAPEALRWYDAYLQEAPSGAYATEALGRKLMLVAGPSVRDDVREVAREYLERYPRGPYAARARALMEGEP